MSGNNPSGEQPTPPPPPPPPRGPEPLGYAPTAGAWETNPEARTWGMLCHLSALAGYVIAAAGWILGPLVVWLIKKDQFPFVDDQGKESLNFQITVMIASLICAPLICVGVGFFVLAAIGILDLVFIIIASIRANAGEPYRYPFAIRLIR